MNMICPKIDIMTRFCHDVKKYKKLNMPFDSKFGRERKMSLKAELATSSVDFSKWEKTHPILRFLIRNHVWGWRELEHV